MAKKVSTNASSDSFVKADAFINLSIETADGRHVQVGGIPLRKTDRIGQYLITAYEEGRIDEIGLSSRLFVSSINLVGAEAKELDLGF